MKRTRHAVAMIGLATGLLLNMVHVQRSYAVDKVCSNDTLNGSYGFYRAGVRVTAPPGEPTGPLAAAGVIIFDGNGHHRGTQSTNVNGVFMPDMTDSDSFIYTYEVYPDCTGKLFGPLNPPAPPAEVEIARLVVIDGGAGIYMVAKGNPVYVVARKIQP